MKHQLLQDPVDHKDIENAYRKAFNNGQLLVLAWLLTMDHDLVHQCWMTRADMKQDIALPMLKW